MDALSPHDPCQEVVCKFSSQTGKTEIMLNFIGYIMDSDPGPILAIQPNVTPMAEAFSKDRVAPMLRDSPSLKAKIGAKGKQRNAGESTILHKKFSGGHLTMAGANSPAGLASRPIRYVLFDEIDRYEATKEGDPIALAVKRTRTFHNRKILKVSSPTYDEVGIDAAYSRCDQQFELHLTCPDCGESQMPKLRHFQWPDNEPHNAVYVCEHCGTAHGFKIEDRIKASADWVCVKDDGIKSKGYWANQWASPFAPWVETIDEFLKAGKNPEKLQAVVNTAFAETWNEAGEQADPAALATFAENYDRDDKVDDILMVTIGGDVQGDRVELQVVGWGYGGVPWIIDHIVLYGDTSKPTSEVWEKVDEAIKQKYCGIKPARVFIDSGYRSDTVYRFTKKRHAMGVFPIKGESGKKDVASKPRQVGSIRAMLVAVGIDPVKVALMAMLKKPGDMIHFSSSLDDEFYSQLTAEKAVIRFYKGFQRIEFHKTRERNEALDCFVYAYAAMVALNPNWDRLANVAKPEPKEEPEEQKPKTYQQHRRVAHRERRGGFVKRY